MPNMHKKDKGIKPKQIQMQSYKRVSLSLDLKTITDTVARSALVFRVVAL